VLALRELLPQPRGFQGFGALRELVHADDLAVAERVDVVEAGIDINPASATAPSQADRYYDTVPLSTNSSGISW
jgi:hypothetical protein